MVESAAITQWPTGGLNSCGLNRLEDMRVSLVVVDGATLDDNSACPSIAKTFVEIAFEIAVEFLNAIAQAALAAAQAMCPVYHATTPQLVLC